ncbi:UNVERIFIED_CONTAM: hypothetical protein PYX00_011240 [Menopon gallinae]|uniref:Uncharacterized protein n=1 Tax=Menopon gallinae TaxID=328185 RepID=A0AAW2H6J7_9NEOP
MRSRPSLISRRIAFDVSINVRNIMAAQTYPVLLRCTVCNTEHTKYASLVPQGAGQGARVSSSVSIACGTCGSVMSAVAEPPRTEYARCTAAEDGKGCWAHVAPDARSATGFHVSTISAANCVVVEVPKLELDVVTGQNVLFRDVPLEENSWTGSFRDNPCAMIDSCDILAREAAEGPT